MNCHYMCLPPCPPNCIASHSFKWQRLQSHGMRVLWAKPLTNLKLSFLAGELRSPDLAPQSLTSAKNRHRITAHLDEVLPELSQRSPPGQGSVGRGGWGCSDSPRAPRLSRQQIFIQQIVIVLESVGASDKNKTQPLDIRRLGVS